MKKSLVALAVLGSLANVALAQSSVTIYGIVDAGISREQGGAAGSVTRVSSGIGSASRLGFRGNEDLGGGWNANFVLEAGARIDTGEIDSAGTLFNRQAYVGIKNKDYGSLSLGRQYTPYYNTITAVADPFAAGYAGSAKNLLPAAGANTRSSNAIVYVTRPLYGIVTELSYAVGEQAGTSSAGRQFGFSFGYSEGKLTTRLAYNNRNNDVSAATGAASVPATGAINRDNGRNALLAANYDFGVLKAYGAYGFDKGTNSATLPNTSNPFGTTIRPVASTDSRDVLVGAAVPFGATSLLASYIGKNDKTRFNQDARQYALGLTHALSKRTSVYTSYAKIKNKRGAGYTVGNNTDIGSGDVAYNVGIRHAF